MNPTDKAARVTGALYLLLVITGIFSLMYVPEKLIVRGNAAATAGNIVAHETVFRIGIVVELISTVIFILVVMALYGLLNGVSITKASYMAVLALVSSAVAFVNVLNSIAALTLFRGAEFLSVMDKPQRDALGMLFLRLHGQGSVINEIFWGLWLFPFGILVMRSGFLPRVLGVLLIVNGFAWVAVSLTSLLQAPFASVVNRYAFIPETGEVWIMLWLLIMGARVPPLPAVVTA
jgi:Domain of unknown function (DUF4386)